jgi:hypothetical protein
LSDKPWSTKSTSSTDTSTDVEAVQVNHKNGEKCSSAENPTKEIIGYNKYTGDPIYEEFKQETYKVGSPTTDVPEYGGGSQIPVAFNKYTGKPIYNNESGLQHATPENSVLEYKPTPIEELKKQNNKYTSLTTIQNDNQYDPEQNFSTKTITASHSLPFAPKRMISYEPTKIKPKKLAHSNSYQFDISKFSDSDENGDEKLDDEDEEYSPLAVSDIKGETKEDNSIGKKTNEKKDDSDTQITKSDVDSTKFVKNVKYFENLLLSDPKKSTFESIQKSKLIEKGEGHLEDNADKDQASSKNGELKTQENRNEKKGDKITKRKSGEANENGKKSVSQSKKDKSLTNSKENKISSEKSKQSENQDKNKNSSGKHNHSSSSKNSHSSTNSSHRSESGQSSNSSHGKSEKSHRKHSDSSKGEIIGSKSHEKSSVSSSDSHKSRQSSHKSSHSKPHKDSENNKSGDKHGKSGSPDKKSDSSKLEKSSGNKHGNSSDREHSHKSSHSEKLSSKKHSERSSKSASDSHKSSSDKKHKTDERKRHHSSNKSSSSESKHSNKSVEKSSNVNTEKRLSTDSDSKKHIMDFNVDLFGEDSDVELLDDSDIESHPLIQDSDLSDNDPYDECLQIFKESHQAKSRQIKVTF